jgi:hypothetical protein
MRVLSPVVKTLMRAMFDRRQDLALGGGIGTQLVCNQPPRRAALFLQL